MNEIIKYLPYLIPIVLMELVLAITALIHVLKHKSYRFGNRPFWTIVVLLVQIIGPIVYFTVGRGDD